MTMEITSPRPILDAKLQTIIEALPDLIQQKLSVMNSVQESSEEAEADNADDLETAMRTNSAMNGTLHCLCV
jgi:hypothetical protein